MPAVSEVRSNGVKNRVAQLIAIADIASLKALYDSGEWADLELAVHGLTLCKYSALAYAAWEEQLEVMRWLLDKGAKANEVRAYHEPPANVAASCGFIAGLELLKERGCDFTKGNSLRWQTCPLRGHRRSPVGPPHYAQLGCTYAHHDPEWPDAR